MKEYLVNRQRTNEKHEVHTTNCDYLPDEKNQIPLGRHGSCHDAVSAAESKGYTPANGCYWCSRICNK